MTCPAATERSPRTLLVVRHLGPTMDRRAFLAGLGGATVALTAGCTEGTQQAEVPGESRRHIGGADPVEASAQALEHPALADSEEVAAFEDVVPDHEGDVAGWSASESPEMGGQPVFDVVAFDEWARVLSVPVAASEVRDLLADRDRLVEGVTVQDVETDVTDLGAPPGVQFDLHDHAVSVSYRIEYRDGEVVAEPSLGFDALATGVPATVELTLGFVERSLSTTVPVVVESRWVDLAA